jgi:hypothetical protein
MRLSKSRFVAGVICLKRLYWQVHEPESAAVRDESSEAILAQGHEVGRLAQRLCPGGIEVEGSHENLDQAIRLPEAEGSLGLSYNSPTSSYEETFPKAGAAAKGTCVRLKLTLNDGTTEALDIKYVD